MTTAASRPRTPAYRGADGGRAGLPRTRRSRLLGIVVLLTLVALAVLASIVFGAKSLSIGQVWSALVAPTGDQSDIIVRSLRVPRTILGILVGGALGIAGALMQGHTRNPLAEPGILGVNAGAAFAVVLAIYTLGITSLLAFVWFAFAGALIASILVFALGSTGRGGATPVTLALAGAAVSAFLFGLVQGLILLDEQTLDVYRFWVVGSLAGRPTGVIVQVAPFLAVGAALGVAGAPGLNALSLGVDVARALGQSVTRTRILGVAAITLLAGGAVAAVGPISFLGLVVPHVARYITGPDHRWLLPYAALLGAAVILLADVLGRLLARPGELQVGIVLALLGAPFFIVLVRRKRLMTL